MMRECWEKSVEDPGTEEERRTHWPSDDEKGIAFGKPWVVCNEALVASDMLRLQARELCPSGFAASVKRRMSGPETSAGYVMKGSQQSFAGFHKQASDEQQYARYDSSSSEESSISTVATGPSIEHG